MREYNNERAHFRKYCLGKMPLQTFRDSVHAARENMLDCLTATPSIGRRSEARPAS